MSPVRDASFFLLYSPVKRSSRKVIFRYRNGGAACPAALFLRVAAAYRGFARVKPTVSPSRSPSLSNPPFGPCLVNDAQALLPRCTLSGGSTKKYARVRSAGALYGGPLPSLLTPPKLCTCTGKRRRCVLLGATFSCNHQRWWYVVAGAYLRLLKAPKTR